MTNPSARPLSQQGLPLPLSLIPTLQGESPASSTGSSQMKTQSSPSVVLITQHLQNWKLSNQF